LDFRHAIREKFGVSPHIQQNAEAKGISAEQMAGRLGIERESVYRLEREAYTRLNPEKQAA
jgi:DNA-binding XRE family transcriptional regulator